MLFCIFLDDDEAKLALFEDSGSDFENDLKKLNNNVAGPPKMSSSDVSSGEDETKEEEKPKPKKPMIQKSIQNMIKKREKMIEVKTNPKNNKSGNSILPSSSMTNLAKSLSLSESSSSEDESPPPKFTKIQTAKRMVAKNVPQPEILPDSDENDFASQWESLAQNCALVKDEDNNLSSKKSPLKVQQPSTSSANIASLLAQG